MTTSTIILYTINAAGLIFDFCGVYRIYKSTPPPLVPGTYLDIHPDGLTVIQDQYKDKHNKILEGFKLIAIGFIFQLISAIGQLVLNVNWDFCKC